MSSRTRANWLRHCGTSRWTGFQLLGWTKPVLDDAGPQVAFQAEQLYDFLGNKLPGRTAQLRLAPVYAVGLSKDDPFYKQTAYSLDTPYLVVPTAGDTVTPVLRVNNNRAAALQGVVRMTLPAGWTAEKQEFAISAAPGEKVAVPLPFTVNPQEPLGQKTVKLTISEGEKIKEIPLQVLVQMPLIMQAGPIMGQPGKAAITVKVGNRSSQPVSGTLRLQLPASWKAATPEQNVEALKPREIRELKCEFEWNTGWKADESAAAIFAAADGKTVQRPIIPKAYRLHKAPALEEERRERRVIHLTLILSGWLARHWPPADTQLPQWILGSSLGEPQAKVWLAWAKEGLYGAVEVHDSQLLAADPRSFWNGDCLEIFVDTSDDKRQREYEAGDHQFWFVPLVNENRVYVGRWKRKDEIPATHLRHARHPERRRPQRRRLRDGVPYPGGGLAEVPPGSWRAAGLERQPDRERQAFRPRSILALDEERLGAGQLAQDVGVARTGGMSRRGAWSVVRGASSGVRGA